MLKINLFGVYYRKDLFFWKTSFSTFSAESDIYSFNFKIDLNKDLL